MTTTQNPPSIFDIMATAMRGYDLDRLIDIITELESKPMGEDERIIRVAAHQVIENRHPEIVPVLEARIDEDLTYTELVISVLLDLNIWKVEG